MCTSKNIQELLPAYLEEALDQNERSRVELHLSACDDCRREIELLRVLAAQPVPDPGDAFWAAMPGRIERAMRAEEEQKRSWWSSSVPVSFALPRWAWAAAMVVVVAALSLLLVRPVPVRIARITAPERVTQNAPTAADVLELADLSEDEVDAVDLWASEELSLLQDDIIDSFRNGAEASLDDRLTELNAEELEELSRMLDDQNEEG
ncbi:MAG: zf-HC2 domain-containing protein [Nitrospirota bacterium]